MNGHKLTNASCEYTGGGNYVYQAKYNGYWVYGNIDEWMYAFKIEPFRYAKRTDSTEAPWHRELHGVEFPTWQEIIDSLRDPEAEIFGDREECIEIIKASQILDVPSNVETPGPGGEN